MNGLHRRPKRSIALAAGGARGRIWYLDREHRELMDADFRSLLQIHAVGRYLDAGGVPMITTGAPSELIFACRIMNGTSPGFAHWWTRP